MKNIKFYLRKIIYTVPGAQNCWIRLNKFLGRETKADFSGWGMTTHTFTPWHNGGDELARGFLKANQQIITKVMQGEFKLSQFNEVQDKKMLLNELMWRHYIVFWSVHYAFKATNYLMKNLVECGVCDGMSAYFAMSALTGRYEFKAFLYDAWEGMKSEHLLESEMGSVGAYNYLDIENTKYNLAEFQGDATFIKGSIPESFKTSNNPTELVWLHIDLNSALPTTAALQFFFEKMPPGGVILFDDYAWHGYYDTKLEIDEFFSSKRGVLLPLPTGQAIYFKH
jgi:O-methyltransferase